jgi:hypothetical protein
MLTAGFPIGPSDAARVRRGSLHRDSRPRPTKGAISLDKGLVIKKRTLRNFLDALLAVLAGNAIYFLLMPHLPAVIRHRLFKEDLGLLVDFLICTAVFVVVKYARKGGT